MPGCRYAVGAAPDPAPLRRAPEGLVPLDSLSRLRAGRETRNRPTRSCPRAGFYNCLSVSAAICQTALFAHSRNIPSLVPPAGDRRDSKGASPFGAVRVGPPAAKAKQTTVSRSGVDRMTGFPPEMHHARAVKRHHQRRDKNKLYDNAGNRSKQRAG